MGKVIEGFSKLSKSEKIDWITKTHFKDPKLAKKRLEQYWNNDPELQKSHDEFIENTISNFYIPLGVAPNFLINEKIYSLPMAIEESSVVAAAGNSAKFWSTRGGFKTKIIETVKVGQVHFLFYGDSKKLNDFFIDKKEELLRSTESLTKKMDKRGGGIQSIELVDKTNRMNNYFQLHLRFKTDNAMGANFINSCLEQVAKKFLALSEKENLSKKTNKRLEIIMSILSNYTPECIVRASISCRVENFILHKNGSKGIDYAKRFINAVEIANIEPYRAVTHNKGIMNGVDALIIATGNDFRAIEAGVHAYAARSGEYKSLSNAYIKDEKFCMELTLPISLGTVGGLTKLHPMANWCLELLGNPGAEELMEIVAVAGLAQNFAALRSLITSGIQKGHMKMHLTNILNQLQANENEKLAALKYFEKKSISVDAVEKFLNEITFK